MRPDGGSPTIGGLLAELRRGFQAKGIETAGLDARLLVGGLLGLDAAALLTRDRDEVSPQDAARVRDAMAERISGSSVHRILGSREFHGLLLKLSADTLEPRPDTETLVEAALPLVEAVAAERGACHILDLGIGTGAIGLALVAACPAARCLGIDISPGAVEIAAENASTLGLSDRYEARTGNWFENISERFDVIVSNPPYIVSSDIETLSEEVRLNDPLRALDGGPDGLDAYRAIAERARGHLRPGGYVVLEIGAGQAADVAAIFAQAGMNKIGSRYDLGGIERALMFGLSKF